MKSAPSNLSKYKVLQKKPTKMPKFGTKNDFNMTIENKNLEVFMNSFGLECYIKKPTCFQSKNPSCIDLTMINK